MDDNINKKSLIVKSNNLIESYMDDLSVIEHKILLISISKLKPTDKNPEITFTSKSFCDLLKINKIGMYSHIKKACDKLLKRTVTIQINKKNWIKFPWITKIQYINGLIKIKFNSELEPYLLFYKENRYTKYFLENIIDMDSKYSIRIYELLKQYNKIGYRELEITTLKKYLGLSNKYKKYNDFKKYVLEISKKEINGLTDIFIDYEEIKIGRKIENLKYTIHKKNYNINTTEYNLLPKLKLISILYKKIYDRTGYIFNFKELNKYHRIVLISLIKKFDNSGFNDILIQYPNAFFHWHLKDISQMYDLSKIEDF